MPARTLRVWIVLIGVWAIPALLTTSQMWGRMRMEGSQGSLWPTFAVNLLTWYLWGALTPLILFLKDRFPLEDAGARAIRLGSIPVHLGAGLILSLLHGAVMVFAYRLAEPESLGSMSWSQTFLSYELSFLVFDYLTYVTILAAAYAIDFYRRLKEREVAAERLRGRLVESRLQALQMQIHPHFLFNTLHAVAVLIEEEPADAAHMLDLLGDLLRMTLESESAQEVRLEQEMEFLDRYLEIQRTRFQDRLRVETSVAEGLLDALVPNLALQPLVENAVRYAVEPRRGPGTIRVRAMRTQDDLVLEVRDEGPGADAHPVRPSGMNRGIGLANLHERLEALYGSAASLELRDSEGGGTEAVLRIPYRESARSQVGSR